MATLPVISVAEPSHFYSAPAPDILFPAPPPGKNIDSGSTHKSSAPTGSGSRKQILMQNI